MTVRLGAMFEEHMSKIIYNWKVAKRRETAQNNKKHRRNNRKRYSTAENDSNTSDASEDEGQNERINGYTRNNTHNNKKSAASTSDEGPSTSYYNHKSVRHKSDSEESYKPTVRKRPRRYPGKLNNRHSSTSEQTGSDDDSDNQPLSMHVGIPRLRPKQNKCVTKENSSDSGEVNKMSRRQCKRPRYFEDTDSDNSKSRVSRQRNGDNSEEDSDGCLVTVSSRGRVRKLTARARALLRK